MNIFGDLNFSKPKTNDRYLTSKQVQWNKKGKKIEPKSGFCSPEPTFGQFHLGFLAHLSCTCPKFLQDNNK